MIWYLLIYIVVIFVILLFAFLNKTNDNSSFVKQRIITPICFIVLTSCIFLILLPKEDSDDSVVILDGVIYELIQENNYSEYYDYKNIDEDICVYNYYFNDFLNAHLYDDIYDIMIDQIYIENSEDESTGVHLINTRSYGLNDFSNTTYCVSGFTSDLVEDVVIPKEINGVLVSDIGYNAFNGATINSFTTNSYLIFHPYAVSNCINLEYINICNGFLLPVSFYGLDNVVSFNTQYNIDYSDTIGTELFDASICSCTISKMYLGELPIYTKNSTFQDFLIRPNYSRKYPLIYNCDINYFYLENEVTTLNKYKKQLECNNNIIYASFNNELNTVVYIDQSANCIYLPILQVGDFYTTLTPITYDGDKIILNYFDILSSNNDEIYIYLDNSSDDNIFELVDNKLIIGIKISDDTYERYELLDLSSGNYIIKYIN